MTTERAEHQFGRKAGKRARDRYRPCWVEARLIRIRLRLLRIVVSSDPERNLEKRRDSRLVEGRPCLGVALNEFREDSGKLAPQVALVFVDLA